MELFILMVVPSMGIIITMLLAVTILFGGEK